VADAERDPARIQFAKLLLDDEGLVRISAFELVSHLCARGDDQALLLGQFACGDYASAAGRVDSDGFFDEYVFAGLNCRFEVKGTKQRRRRHEDYLHIGFEQLSITVGTAEAFVGGEIELLSGTLGAVFEVVGGGGYLDVEAEDLARLQGTGSGTATATPAPDEPELKRPARRTGTSA